MSVALSPAMANIDCKTVFNVDWMSDKICQKLSQLCAAQPQAEADEPCAKKPRREDTSAPPAMPPSSWSATTCSRSQLEHPSHGPSHGGGSGSYRLPPQPSTNSFGAVAQAPQAAAGQGPIAVGLVGIIAVLIAIIATSKATAPDTSKATAPDNVYASPPPVPYIPSPPPVPGGCID